MWHNRRSSKSSIYVAGFAFVCCLATGSVVAYSCSAATVVLEWTAGGDDGTVGQATSYDLRYSTNPVGSDTLAWWTAANRVTGLSHPSPSGQIDTANVAGLSAGTTYYFVIRSVDDAGLVSAFSNVASKTTDVTEPAASGSLHAVPNPASNSMEFRVDVPGSVSVPVRIRLFDLTGHLIADLFDGTMSPGETAIQWNRVGRGGSRVAPGYYEALGTIGGDRVRERVVLLP